VKEMIMIMKNQPQPHQQNRGSSLSMFNINGDQSRPYLLDEIKSTSPLFGNKISKPATTTAAGDVSSSLSEYDRRKSSYEIQHSINDLQNTVDRLKNVKIMMIVFIIFLES
jgi:hypothetical protein